MPASPVDPHSPDLNSPAAGAAGTDPVRERRRRIARWTALANRLGYLAFGVAIAAFQAMPQLDPVWRLLLITGFLGGLTTFSSFSAEVVEFLMAGRYGLALLTAGLHVLGSLGMTVLGLKSLAWWLAR
jgi:CrcB protein